AEAAPEPHAGTQERPGAQQHAEARERARHVHQPLVERDPWWAMVRHLRVDEDQLLDARSVGEREVAREGAAGVLRQDGVAIETEPIDQRLQRPSLAREAEVGLVGPLRLRHAGKVRDVALWW